MNNEITLLTKEEKALWDARYSEDYAENLEMILECDEMEDAE